MRLWQKLLSTLLHYANTNPPFQRAEFYALKMRLLEKYGWVMGQELQEIRKECWGPWGDEYGERIGCQGKECRQCGGTGVFDIRWVRLHRWFWNGYIFHCPDGDTRVPPKPEHVNIIGRIEHENYGRKAAEAALWLFLLCGEWRLLWRSLRGSRCCGWVWWPMLNLQKVVMEFSMRLRVGRCHCGKRFMTWGRGWCICKKCRVPSEDIPF